jgi:RimJ/RimL family protein N-acetyltransferase
VQAVERSAAAAGGRLVGIEREAEWAYGERRDRMIVEVLRDDFPGHPATAHLRAV